jgi:hypothetical protein
MGWGSCSTRRRMRSRLTRSVIDRTGPMLTGDGMPLWLGGHGQERQSTWLH